MSSVCSHFRENGNGRERERQRANCLLYFYSDLEAFYPIITDNTRLLIVACKTFMEVAYGRVCPSKQNIKKCGVRVPFICVFTPVLIKCALNCTPFEDSRPLLHLTLGLRSILFPHILARKLPAH